MYIKCKVVSKISNRMFGGEYEPIQLLEMSPDDLIQSLVEVDCTCNTESGYSYCGCGDEFEECALFVDGKIVKERW